jgi:hypothetical protein
MFRSEDLSQEEGQQIEIDSKTTVHLSLLNAGGIVLKGPLLVFANGRLLDCYLAAELNHSAGAAKRILAVHMDDRADHAAPSAVREAEIEGIGAILAGVMEET